MNTAALTVRYLKTFNGLIVGSLIVLLSSCASLKAPKTLFITYGIDEQEFRAEITQIRSFLNKYTEAFQRSNPDVNVVFINYKSKNLYDQITKDSSLNLGPDLIITQQFAATELFARGLITTLPKQQNFNAIYSQRVQSVSKTNAGYLYAPWLISSQIACFNKTKVKDPPSTIQEFEELSASGKRIGLASNFFELFWTAGTQAASSEFSTLGGGITTNQAYPGIQAWLQWLQRAALYKNISFHENSKELSKKLKNNELDWVTCWGGVALEDLKKTMGNNLGVAALPNGSTSKAFPSQIFYGFSLGKNSSPSQRAMALKFIKSNVNTTAQRKIQLDDLGYLAANQTVSIPPENSQIQTAINISYNEQSQSYLKERSGVLSYAERYGDPSRTLSDFIDGTLDVDEAMEILTTPQTN